MITHWEEVRALEPQQLWTEETVRERLDYETCPGISLALVGVTP